MATPSLDPARDRALRRARALDMRRDGALQLASRVVARLHPPEGYLGGSLAEHAAIRRVLGPGPVYWAIETARDTTDLVVETNHDNPNMPRMEIARAAETMLLAVLEHLVGRGGDSRLSVDQQRIVRDAAAEEIPFERVVASLRLVQAHWTDLILCYVCAEDDQQVVRHIVGVIARYFDRTVDQVVTAYLQERERLLISVSAQRRELIDAIVAGRAVDENLVHRRVGVEPGDHHVAFVIGGGRSSLEADDRRPERVAATLANALGAARKVVHHTGADEWWLWASGPRPLDAAALDAMAAAVIRAGLRASAGSCQAGVAGMRRSHLEAIAAHRVGGFRPVPGLVHYAQVDLGVLLSSDLERARWFVDDHLGWLAQDDPDARDLRETLDQYYASSMSLLAAAKPLHVHRNTVVYRLRRIEQILGHPVTEKVAQVRCALLLVAQLGDAVLAEGAETGDCTPDTTGATPAGPLT